MPKTLAEIIEAARDEVNEPVAAFFKDDQIMRHFNKVQVEFVKKTKILKVEVELSIEADNVTVNLPADYMAARFVHLKTDDGEKTLLYPAAGQARSKQSLLNQDVQYYITGNVLTLTKEQDSTSDSILLNYHNLPFLYADEVADINVECAIEDTYIDDVLSGVIALMFKRRRELREAAAYDQEYNQAIISARRFENNRDGIRRTNVNQ